MSTSATEANIDGSGSIILSGNSGSLRSLVKGSGQLIAEDMPCDDVFLNVSGSGKARVFAKRSLEVAISGSGIIYYNGQAGSIKKNITGSGRLEKI